MILRFSDCQIDIPNFILSLLVSTPPPSTEADLVSQISELAKEVVNISVQVSLARESLFRNRQEDDTLQSTDAEDSHSSTSSLINPEPSPSPKKQSLSTNSPTISSSSQFVTDTVPDTVSAGNA